MNDLIRMLFCQLLEIKAYLEAAREIDYRIGKCGELVRACLAKLLQIEPKLTIAKFNYYNKDAPSNNHTFLVMHLGEPKIIYDANNWDSDTLICDPYMKEKDRLYFPAYASRISALNERETVDTTELQLLTSKSIIEKLYSEAPSLATEVSGLIQHNGDLLSELQLPHNRPGPKV